jgi:Asp-tRNA(Asn)/Glu-tRNA(Gln) amidotransferase A subunit family amidase
VDRDDPTELLWTDAVAQAAAIRGGRVSATALLDAYLDRIERFNPELRAFVTVDVDDARASARADDAVRRVRVRSCPRFTA